MDVYEVVAAEATATMQGTPIWMVSMQKPDGGIHCHAFPPSTIEWRMAEYGLDSVAEALDIVLHEPYAIDPSDPFGAIVDPAAKAGAEPIRLHNAPTITEARAAHRVRIADAKTRVRVTPPKGKPDPLDAIRQRHGVTERGLREKAALVDAARRSVRGEIVPGELSAARVLEADTPGVKGASRA